MSIGYKFTEQYGYYFISFAVIEWIDVFTRNEYREVIVGSLNHCIEHKGLLVYSYVIMTNHIHLVASLHPDKQHTLADVIRDLKK